MMLRNVVITACFLTLSLLCNLHAANTTKPEPGPENGGLRLRLKIQNRADNEQDDSREIRLDLTNVGKEPVVLVGHWDYEDRKGNYADYFRHAVEFTTFPEVLPDDAQTSGQFRKSMQPQHEIKPGKSLAIAWTERGRVLKFPNPEDWSDHLNTAPTFPSNGLYGVRASITVVTKTGQRVMLTSNEQQVIVGGSHKMPKFATALVTSVDSKKKWAAINIGSDQRIEAGDTFRIRRGLSVVWYLKIDRVETQIASGSVEIIYGDGAMAVQPFPEEGMLATLVSPEQVAETHAAKLSRQVLAVLPEGWQLEKVEVVGTPSRWTGKTTAIAIRFRHRTLKFALSSLNAARFTLWRTPREYDGQLKSANSTQPGGAVYWGSTQEHRWFVSALAPEQKHWKEVENALLKHFSIKRSSAADKVE